MNRFVELMDELDSEDDYYMPLNFNREYEISRIVELKNFLEEEWDSKFILDDTFINASVFASLKETGKPPPTMSIRFSTFGNFVTVYFGMRGDSSVNIPSGLIGILSSHGYTYIPIEYLRSPYNGPNAKYGIKTYFDRFFQWL